MVKQKFGFADLATVDDEMRSTAIDWIKAHAKDDKPFFIYLNYEKCHNPNNPSTEVEGQVAGRRHLSRRADGGRRQFRPGGAGDP